MFSKFSNMTVAIIIALIFIVAAMYFSNFNSVWRKSFLSMFGRLDQVENNVLIGIGDDPYLGRDNAKVTIVEFYDFQCPSCALFHFGAGDAILEKYVKNGLARIVYKDFPFLGEESLTAAYAARCANEQGKFFEYYDLLFSRQAESGAENANLFSYSRLSAFAAEVGANQDLFESCLSAGKYKASVLKSLEDGKAAGVTATPTIFINNQKVEGSATFESYQKIIEEELIK